MRPSELKLSIRKPNDMKNFPRKYPVKMILPCLILSLPSNFLPAIDAGPLLTSLGNRKVPVYLSGRGSYPWP